MMKLGNQKKELFLSHYFAKTDQNIGHIMKYVQVV